MDKHQFGAAPTPWASATPPALAWHQERPYESAPRYAGFWRRYLAATIDTILLRIAGSLLSSILDPMLERVVDAGAFADSGWLGLGGWLVAAFWVFIVFDWLYHAGSESSEWQATLGKCLLGAKVTDLAGNRISFGRATGRYFARYVSLATLLVGYLIQPFTKKRQALHDLIAGTLVVRA